MNLKVADGGVGFSPENRHVNTVRLTVFPRKPQLEAQSPVDAGPGAQVTVVPVVDSEDAAGTESGVAARAGAAPARTALDVVVTTMSSDAHTWNLVYLQLLLEELGCRVTNLGACTPDETILRECVTGRPDLLVVSSLNGHGYQDGLRLIRTLRAAAVTTPAVIGGKLDVAGGDDGGAARLLAAGFDAVFEDAGELTPFRSFVRTLAVRAGAARAIGPGDPTGAG